MRSTRNRVQASASGFSLVEVIISMFLTAVVMGAVYGLLLKGQQAFDREPDVVDVQQSARTALSLVSADVLQGGTGLPAEFPVFTPPVLNGQNTGAGDQGANPDVLEIIGNLQNPDQPQQLPEQLLSGTGFDGTASITLASSQTNLDVENLVVVYNDNPTGPVWWLGKVTAKNVTGPNAQLTVAQSAAGTLYNFPSTTPSIPQGFVTRVSVVRYSAGLSSDPTTECTVAVKTEDTNQTVDDPCVLRRTVDFGTPLPVGTVFDFQVNYVIDANANGVADPGETQVDPIVPTADPNQIAQTVVSNVNVQVAARALAVNEFIQKTFATMVNPRNITSGVGVRTRDNANGPAYQ